MNMINTLYRRHYDIKQLFVTPGDTGHAAAARDRTYFILTLRSSVVAIHDVETVYKDKSNCNENVFPLVYLILHEQVCLSMSYTTN